MNERKSSGLIIVLIATLLIFCELATTLADNIAPEVQTQINKRTDLFEQSLSLIHI